ncbi:DUF5677 domain-containing protein [Lysinibacillus fusiformis]|uniref:DUF5677 domain-containing protein n=1 Tax=Lysinibacillus fusiformis TaxID=28031 RepID=UPI002E1E2471|nr:hypothetical protein [Lysinibacillus fusiformis]
MEDVCKSGYKGFQNGQKERIICNPTSPFTEKVQSGSIYVYSLAVGHVWLITLINNNGYKGFVKEIIDLVGELENDLLEWNIRAKEEKKINKILVKYNLQFKRILVSGFNPFDYTTEFELVREKNHPYHAISRILHIQKTKIEGFNFINFESDLEQELTEKSTMVNAMYLGLLQMGKVEKNIEIPQYIQKILREYSPCVNNEKNVRYYNNVKIEGDYLSLLPNFFSANWEWFDEEEEVLFSKLIYSMRIINELRYSLLGCNGILAAASTRILFDNYWQTKYLIEKNEISAYREFAVDRMRLHILKRLNREDEGVENIEILMLASKNQLLDPIPIHGDYFKKSAREYAIELNIKEDYDKYYEYNSEFIHASMTAVYSGIMTGCENPEHGEHLTISHSTSRYINAMPQIFDILNKHIRLINNYLNEDVLEELKFEDYFFTDRTKFLEAMEEVGEKIGR